MKRSVKKQLAACLAVVLAAACISDAGSAIAASRIPREITMNKKMVLIRVNGRASLKVAGVNPANASKKVIYKISNRRIASVSKSGVVKGKRAGITTVLAASKVNRRAYAMVKIVVAKYVPKRVKLSKKTLSMKVGTKKTLKAVVVPKKTKASNKKGTWTTDNQEVVTVSSKGVVTARKAGKANITFTTLNGKKAVCKVTVTEGVPVAVPSPSPTTTPSTTSAVSAAALAL